MTKIILIISMVLLSGAVIFGQNKFPVPVKPADTLIFKTRAKSYILNSLSDTLWVLKNSQFQSALGKAKKLKLVEEQNDEYKKLTETLKSKSVEQDSLVAIYIKDRDYYQKNWNICENDLDYMTKKYRKNNIFKKISIIAIPAAFVVGYFVGK